MDPGLLIAQVNHGPDGGMALLHLGAVVVLVGGLALLVVRGRGPGSERNGAARLDGDLGDRPEERAVGADGTESPSARRPGERARPRPPAAKGSPPDAVVAVRSLTKRYGLLAAVDGLDFSLEVGTVTGFLGPNGAGKTTTLRLLLGLAEPTEGEALVFGHRYRDLARPARRVGAVLESNDFHPGRSGRDHVRALALAADIPASRVDEVLSLVELDAAAGRRVGTYSLGMRRRIGLAAALLGDPELLVLDEPANGLDPAGVRWLRRFLRRFAEQGGTVLVSSHALAEVAQTVDRVLIIDRGRLVASGRLDELAGRGRTLEDTYLEVTGGGAS